MKKKAKNTEVPQEVSRRLPVTNSNFMMSVYLQDQGDGKVILTTVVTKEALGMAEMPAQAFAMGTMSINMFTGMNPSLQLRMDKVMPADEWAKQVGESESLKGRGIQGILTSCLWFCKKVGDPFGGLLG